MLNDAAQFLKIDLVHSVMVGDKAEDMQAAKAAGVTTRILVRSGKVIADDSDATVVLDSIADVPAYLKSLG